MNDTYFISDSFPMMEEDNTSISENEETDEIISSEEVLQENIYMPWQMIN